MRRLAAWWSVSFRSRQAEVTDGEGISDLVRTQLAGVYTRLDSAVILSTREAAVVCEGLKVETLTDTAGVFMDRPAFGSPLLISTQAPGSVGKAHRHAQARAGAHGQPVRSEHPAEGVERPLSYDLQVFSRRSLSLDELRQLVAAAGLAVEDSESTSGALTVLRGAKGRYSFTLGMPAAVETEDVPEEVTAVLLAPTCLYELLVEGSSAAETPHAVRFARRLAEASGGVVLDQQTGRTWHRGKLRTSSPVERGSIDVVQLRWYTRLGDTEGAAARAWLDLARRHLPEALPRRFGSVEPLAMKLDIDGPEAFVKAVTAEDWSLHFKGSAPCIDGNLAGSAGALSVRSHSLSVHRGPLSDPGWRDALQRLFIDFAATTGVFFASAEVQRGLEWSGRSVWYGGKAERTTYLAARGRWGGLPPYPVWWTWFGPAYAPLVAEHLPPDQVEHLKGGLFHSRGREPLDRDQLVAALASPTGESGARRGLLARLSRRDAPSSDDIARTWLPGDLQASVDTSDPNLYNPPLEPARTVPPELAPPT
ncbi:hypothetical protein ACRYCC_15350 [Actinomadura scrupuli]|uniref:hypothetical protein n=1 Tax=Actinomadura scrupuli TaxID=559629 RepID=UPI003D98F6A8